MSFDTAFSLLFSVWFLFFCSCFVCLFICFPKAPVQNRPCLSRIWKDLGEIAWLLLIHSWAAKASLRQPRLAIYQQHSHCGAAIKEKPLQYAPGVLLFYPLSAPEHHLSDATLDQRHWAPCSCGGAGGLGQGQAAVSQGPGPQGAAISRRMKTLAIGSTHLWVQQLPLAAAELRATLCFSSP